jgi:serine/threonine protein kinase
MDIPAGTVINGYQFYERIGFGGFASVYRVYSSRFSTEFAAKVILPDGQDSHTNNASYEAEMSALKSLSHPNIILLFDAFPYHECYCLIIELCKRGTLKDEILSRERHRLPMERFKSVAEQILDALSYCHSHDVCHCDIKPSNILVDEYGRPKLADFGIAQMVEPAAVFDRASLPFAAPEIIRGQVVDRQKVDIWALGITFVYLLDGRLPWRTEDPTAMRTAIVQGAYTIQRHVKNELGHLLHKMLTVDPEERWSAEQLKRHPFFVTEDANPIVRTTSAKRIISGVLPASLSQTHMRVGSIKACPSQIRRTSTLTWTILSDVDEAPQTSGP